jgi:5'-3' exonuclease
MFRLLIIDGHAYAYRAFYAIRELKSPSGRPTNAIYGFIKMLSKVRAGVQPTHVIVVWDGGLSPERMAALPDYKAHRPEMPAELESQIEAITEYLNAEGIASFCRAGVEADDYVACLTRHAAAADMEVVIASSDKDFMQLVASGVSLLNPGDKTETLWSAEQVRNKTGVVPEQIVDWLSLIGDSVDNIPGVPGVGPKTAADLLNRFGSLDELYEQLAEVKSDKLRASLQAAEKIARRNRGLIRLKSDLACEFSPHGLAERAPDLPRLRELFARWGFKSMLAGLEKMQAQRECLL